ncbi:trigger factor [Aequorivita sublithincola DSM 14238]|uniref:Trigger factor n=1 Tax=Aequorivita sublithincola (strain DSM 14238 / LMG 21431 / ACAM 643 / 9-3) TaxID=746697 RepID=I3YTL7_AEQSU|nr:trigger factor [Aequorivita sublithincola]AFL80335.1 trigger factor [Aequorivita sublithincola DSM 14238]
MNIIKKEIDKLNAVLTVEVSKEDYSANVEKVLNNYKKTANIPGFRKGQIPMGMVKKQYGKAVLVEEVNKVLQGALHKYLTEEKLDILGNPLPKNEAGINWDDDNYSFEFELGLAPQFNVDVKGKEVLQYKIVADDEMLNNQVKTIRKQYGKLISKKEVEKGDEITGTFTSTEKEIEKKTTLSTDEIAGKKQLESLIGAKVGDTVTLKTKGMFADDHDNQKYLGVAHDEAHGLDIEVSFNIEEVNKREMAELNQELFDKLFGEGKVSSEEELKAKIKEDAEGQFAQQSDQKLLNDVVESLIENTKFDLPQEFLQRWIAMSGEKRLSEEDAKAEFERSEKGLRYQLIEGKLRAENKLQVTFDELKDYSKNMIKAQMAQYGQMDPSDEEMESITARILSNKEEVERLSEQLNSAKLLNFFKENAKLKTKEITYDKFIKEAYA